MDNETLKQIVEKAKADPQFFHALIFEPDKALNQLSGVDRAAKGKLLATDPERLLSDALAPLGGTGCGKSCDTSCDYTCGNRSCPSTCGSSCGQTCNTSCRFTLQIT